MDEASPLDTVQPAMIKDQFESMDKETRKQFDQAVKDAQSQQKQMAEQFPTAARVIREGIFKARAHEVQGRASIIEHNGQRTLRFEDFKTINGPNLHIYLSSELGNTDFIDLGPIRATEGNVNYIVSADIDISRYNKVMVWCVPFGVLFSYAELK